MTDEISIGKLAKKINLTDVKPEGVANDRKDKVAGLFNTQNTGNDASILTTDELVVLNQIDANHNGKITEDEIKAYYNANYNDNNTKNPNQVSETEYIAYVKAMAKANQEALEADATNVGNTYTIQLGESLDDLASRVAKSLIDNPSSEDIASVKQQIIELNKNNGAIKFDAGGNVKWLVGGQELILPTDTSSDRAKKNVKNQNNKAQVESKYKAWRDGRGPLKSFTYKIDENGNTYEVRSGEETEFDATKMYSAGTGGYDDNVDASTIVDLTDADYGNFASKKDEVNARIKKATDILNKLKDSDNIESIGDVYYDSDNKCYSVDITMTDGEIVYVRMRSDGSLIGVCVDLDGESYLEIGFFNGSINLSMTDNQSDWDLTGLGKVDMEKLKALIPQEAMDKLKDEISQTETFSDEDKKQPVVLRVAYYASNPLVKRSGWVRVLTPDGKMYNANTSASAFTSVEKMIDKGCADLKEQLKNAGWTNVTLVNPNAGDGFTSVSKTAPQNTSINKNKAYQIYVPRDSEDNVARVTLPDGTERVFNNVTTKPSESQEIKDWIKEQGFTHVIIRDNM